MSSLDAAITAQLHSLKAAQAVMGNPMMGAPPRPGMMMPGLGGLQAPPPQPQLGPGPPPGPNNAVLLSVAVDNLPFQYNLQEADLREMCQRWGQVHSTHIYRDGAREVGVIVFADPIDAADCQRQLHGHSCSFDSPNGAAQGSLAAVIGPPEPLAPPVPRQQAMQGPPGAQLPAGGPGQFTNPGAGPPMGGPPPMGQPQPGFAPQGQQQMMGMGMQGAVAKGGPPPGEAMKGNGKATGKGGNGWSQPPPGWSCKVIVHAERLHPDFPTVLKICGQDGANMGHIRSQGNCTVELRGMRSGTMDPRTGQELQENMFLWLAAEAPEQGLPALEMVKDLLGSVYDEHQQWCIQNKLNWSENLQPQVVENPHLTEGFQ